MSEWAHSLAAPFLVANPLEIIRNCAHSPASVSSNRAWMAVNC